MHTPLIDWFLYTVEPFTSIPCLHSFGIQAHADQQQKLVFISSVTYQGLG